MQAILRGNWERRIVIILPDFCGVKDCLESKNSVAGSACSTCYTTTRSHMHLFIS